jgi:YGGT family
MQTRTRPPDEPDATGDGGIIEREVETIRTREHVAGAAVDAIPASETVVSERSVGYFETQRLSAVGLVARTAIEALLGVRFLLHASGANTSSAFVGFVDDVSWPFAAPFANVFSNRSLGSGGIEVSTLVAMGVYFLIFRLLGMLVTALAPRLSGVAARRSVTAPWSSTLLSPTPPPPADDERHQRPRPVAATGVTRRHRRLLRLARARKVVVPRP